MLATQGAQRNAVVEGDIQLATLDPLGTNHFMMETERSEKSLQDARPAPPRGNKKRLSELVDQLSEQDHKVTPSMGSQNTNAVATKKLAPKSRIMQSVDDMEQRAPQYVMKKKEEKKRSKNHFDMEDVNVDDSEEDENSYEERMDPSNYDSTHRFNP
jgi:glycine betaine/choline ABC-type transport system substrate-binding protein